MAVGIAAYVIFWGTWGLVSGVTTEMLIAGRIRAFAWNLAVWTLLVFSVPWLGCWMLVRLEKRPLWRVLYWASPLYIMVALWGLTRVLSYAAMQQSAVYLAIAVPAFAGGYLLYRLARAERQRMQSGPESPPSPTQ
jgi:hypothetical protein